jgi:CRISPR/Cas system-associated endonuclease/helicase Cas3
MEKLDVKNVIHLSASLTPSGRERVLSRVLQMLKNGEPVHLVCTSIVQTGVDISFPYVYREMCGWTALHQASGRCNRNAEREIGYCIMFAKTGDDIPGLPALQTKAMEYLLNNREVNGDPEKIDKKAYWDKYVELYKAACKNGCPFDKNRVESFEIVDEDLSFETISEKARIIEDGQQVLMVMCDESRPYIEKMERFYSITTEEKEKLSKEEYTGMIPTKIDRRIVQRYSVNCYGSDYKKDNEQKSHLVHWLVTNGYAHKVGDDETADLVNHIGGTYVLDKGYDEVFGISSLMDQFISSKKGNR